MSKTLTFALALILSVFAFAAPLPNVVLVFGDSLSAGYGIAENQSWPTLLAQRLAKGGTPYTVINASVSGETSTGGRARFDAALKQFHPRLVILELGANDALRGQPMEQLQSNLTAMIRAARTHGAKVLLVGMSLPPNYGSDYINRFQHAYADVAQQEKVPLVPFLLEPIKADQSAFQPDGLHPVAAAQPKLLEHVWKTLRPLL
ncbi:MAG TPA: arylesterase [Rhodocyclaceae bacterium]|nr:arylesterase [Rhodocyclaceae bacterium]